MTPKDMKGNETMSNETLQPKDLIFAVASRCSCGAGLAYRRVLTRGDEHAWECSTRLLGLPGVTSVNPLHSAPLHDEPKPFAFYEIKSEGQPSAGGMTTRRVPLTPLELAEIEEDRRRTVLASALRKLTEADSNHAKAEHELDEARAAVAALKTSDCAA